MTTTRRCASCCRWVSPAFAVASLSSPTKVRQLKKFGIFLSGSFCRSVMCKKCRLQDYGTIFASYFGSVFYLSEKQKKSSVPDPWHFGVDPDPDPQIHASDKWIRIRNLDPDPAIFVIGLQDASKKLFFNTIFSAYYFLKVHLHHFPKIKSQKESLTRRNQGFSNYFCMMIEDPDLYIWLVDPDPDPGGPKTWGSSGSGSGTLRRRKGKKIKIYRAVPVRQ